MRVSTADSTAWISADEHVQTTGCLCTWSCSATYCSTRTHKELDEGWKRPIRCCWERLSTHSLTCPCQSVQLTKIRLSGSAESDNKIWFSWSYTTFLRSYAHTGNHTHTCWVHKSPQSDTFTLQMTHQHIHNSFLSSGRLIDYQDACVSFTLGKGVWVEEGTEQRRLFFSVNPSAAILQHDDLFPYTMLKWCCRSW